MDDEKAEVLSESEIGENRESEPQAQNKENKSIDQAYSYYSEEN